MSKEIQDIDLKQLIEDETGGNFNKEGYIGCPFHTEKTPSLSVKFFPDKNKWRWKCFGGCNDSGDAIDFIMKHKGINYKAAREYLGMENEKSSKELEAEKVKEYIEWQINKVKNKKGYKLKGLFPFVNEDNKVMYYKAKFLKPDNSKCVSYYHIEDNKVVNSRGGIELPYNYYNILQAIKAHKTVCIVEGEKDANTLGNMHYKATSFKGVDKKNFNWNIFNGATVLVFGDTGAAGEKYLKEIKECIFDNVNVKSYKEVFLRGLKELGDNKDVTDWIESGKKKQDLIDCINGSLDLKNKKTLQQNYSGIYKTVFKTSKDGDTTEEVMPIANFNVLSANTFTNLDTDENRIELEIKNKGYKKLVNGEFRMFVDPKNFETAIDSMRHSFIGTRGDLLKLKEWIADYFIDKEVEVYRNSGIREINGELVYITNNGALKKDGTIDQGLNVDTDSFNTDLTGLTEITKEELKELVEHLFKFNDPKIVYNCLGSEIAKLFNVFYKELSEYSLHVTAYLGESSSGKTVTYNTVIKPLLNIGYKAMTCGSITKFNINKMASESNTAPVVLDEHTMGKGLENKLSVINEFMTNLTGDYDFKRSTNINTQHTFNLTSTLILLGETMPTATSMINRCNIMWFSKNITLSNPEYENSIKWLAKNKILIEKLGFTLKKYVLNNYNIDKFTNDIESIETSFKTSLDTREHNTFINTMMGIKTLENVIKEVSNNEFNMPLGINTVADIIEENIKENVCGGGDTTKSDYAGILEMIDQLAGLTNVADETMKIRMGYEYSLTRDACINLDITAIWPKLIKYNGIYDKSDLMGKNEFIKKLKSSSFVSGETSKDYYKTIKLNNKSRKCYKLKLEELCKLDMPNLAPKNEPIEVEFEELEVERTDYQEEMPW